ncbi:hypothetical protein ACIP3D_09830 [Streptomyces longwoodensis]|uniref:Chaplin domain-containing protein n=1 Tax=Streptomyces longwoodensis TaxID=68231 RepID=A0A101QP43_9ACTN|nr:hypothetical protein [Streptomyces longwoodensis]KUN33398.1 hypothetical protein AQJ30_33945 [Streptomyces longwoodensis]
MRIAQALRITVATSALAGTLLLGAQIAHADDPGTPAHTGVSVTTTGTGGTADSVATPSPTATTGNNPWD